MFLLQKSLHTLSKQVPISFLCHSKFLFYSFHKALCKMNNICIHKKKRLSSEKSAHLIKTTKKNRGKMRKGEEWIQKKVERENWYLLFYNLFYLLFCSMQSHEMNNWNTRKKLKYESQNGKKNIWKTQIHEKKKYFSNSYFPYWKRQTPPFSYFVQQKLRERTTTRRDKL